MNASASKKRIVILGGGLVGVELFGEMAAFVDGILPLYKHVSRDELRILLVQGGQRIMPEVNPKLANYGAKVLAGRRGASIRNSAHVRDIEPGRLYLADETIEADTIVLAAGTAPNPVVAGLPVDKDERRRIVVDESTRCRSHPNVWALGDCASIPKISLDHETALLLREVILTDFGMPLGISQPEQRAPTGASARPLARQR